MHATIEKASPKEFLLYHRPEPLMAFVADPPPSANCQHHRAALALDRVRALIPIAVSYAAAVDDAYRASGRRETDEACSAAFDREDAVCDAVIDGQPGVMSDFIIKATLIRQRLDDGRDVEQDVKKIVDQMIAFKSSVYA